MTNLSPAAQAIADAFEKAWRLSGADPFECCIQPVGAALRAAAHVVAPFPGRYPMNEYMEGFRDAKQNVHHQLIAIAAELEGAE